MMSRVVMLACKKSETHRACGTFLPLVMQLCPQKQVIRVVVLQDFRVGDAPRSAAKNIVNAFARFGEGSVSVGVCHVGCFKAIKVCKPLGVKVACQDPGAMLGGQLCKLCQLLCAQRVRFHRQVRVEKVHLRAVYVKAGMPDRPCFARALTWQLCDCKRENGVARKDRSAIFTACKINGAAKAVVHKARSRCKLCKRVASPTRAVPTSTSCKPTISACTASRSAASSDILCCTSCPLRMLYPIIA